MIKPISQKDLRIGTIGYPAGAMARDSAGIPKNAIFVSPGQSLQAVLDAAAGSGKWIVARAGLHKLPATLRIPSGLTLAGEGTGTKLFLDPESGMRDAIVNADDSMSDVTIRDLVVEGSIRPEPPSDPNSARSLRNQGNRGGIILRGQKEGQMKNITLVNLTVQNCTFNGVLISGAAGVTISRCDFTENGSSVVPGPKLQHNLLITHSSEVRVGDSRLDTSPHGSGIALEHCRGARIDRNEIARNASFGIVVAESQGVTIGGNFIEGNDRSGIIAEYRYRGCENIAASNNQIQFNGGFAIEAYATGNSTFTGNMYVRNRQGDERISTMRYLLME